MIKSMKKGFLTVCCYDNLRSTYVSMSNCPQVNRPRYLTLKDDMQKPDFRPSKKLKAKLTELDTVNCTINTDVQF